MLVACNIMIAPGDQGYGPYCSTMQAWERQASVKESDFTLKLLYMANVRDMREIKACLLWGDCEILRVLIWGWSLSVSFGWVDQRIQKIIIMTQIYVSKLNTSLFLRLLKLQRENFLCTPRADFLSLLIIFVHNYLSNQTKKNSSFYCNSGVCANRVLLALKVHPVLPVCYLCCSFRG